MIREYPEKVFRRYRYRGTIKKVKDGKEETKKIRYNWRKVKIPSIDGEFTLIGVKGFTKEPMYLLTNVGVANKNDASWLIKGYLSRWTIEETYRWIKQEYNLEDIRVQRYISLKNIITILFLVVAFLAIHLLLNPRMRLLLSHIYKSSMRLRDDIHFLFYAISRGVFDLFYRQIPSLWILSPPESPKYLTLLDLMEKK